MDLLFSYLIIFFLFIYFFIYLFFYFFIFPFDKMGPYGRNIFNQHHLWKYIHAQISHCKLHIDQGGTSNGKLLKELWNFKCSNIAF